MSGLVGFLAARPGGDDPLPRMLAAGRVGRQVSAGWTVSPLSIGMLDLPPVSDPVCSADGRFHFWLAGEIFSGGALLPGADALTCRTPEFRAALLATILSAPAGTSPAAAERQRQDEMEQRPGSSRPGREGEPASRRLLEAIAAGLDGEFQLALWDAREERLTIALDRFAGLPLFLARGTGGVAFGGRVASVLAAPGITAEPDLDALREAVTFGGYRLEGRTLVRGVEMLPGAAVVTLEPGAAPRLRRAWRWADLPRHSDGASVDDLLPELRVRWERAVDRRLVGAARPGQTLSGGLDSRAILAVAAPRAVAARRGPFTAVTYGLPSCDDALYAERAARVAGAEWSFLVLYQDLEGADWFERRERFVLETDGLIDLHDLGHLESIPLQAEKLDVHLSGYIGDAVLGPTFHDITTAAGVLGASPYLGGPLALPWPEALARAEGLVAELGGASARFALFEHKLPQSTNRWATAFRPWFRVRKPFTDLELFDFCQGLPPALRGPGRLYEHFLVEAYPALFRHIPNQKTGLPVLASPLRFHLARALRFAGRRLGLSSRRRGYTDDHAALVAPRVWPRIEATVLRPGSLAVEVFGRTAVTETLAGFRDRAEGPVQTIGALWSFETYWRDREFRGRC